MPSAVCTQVHKPTGHDICCDSATLTCGVLSFIPTQERIFDLFVCIEIDFSPGQIVAADAQIEHALERVAARNGGTVSQGQRHTFMVSCTSGEMASCSRLLALSLSLPPSLCSLSLFLPLSRSLSLSRSLFLSISLFRLLSLSVSVGVCVYGSECSHARAPECMPITSALASSQENCLHTWMMQRRMRHGSLL